MSTNSKWLNGQWTIRLRKWRLIVNLPNFFRPDCGCIYVQLFLLLSPHRAKSFLSNSPKQSFTGLNRKRNYSSRKEIAIIIQDLCMLFEYTYGLETHFHRLMDTFLYGNLSKKKKTQINKQITKCIERKSIILVSGWAHSSAKVSLSTKEKRCMAQLHYNPVQNTCIHMHRSTLTPEWSWMLMKAASTALHLGLRALCGCGE